MSVQAVTASPIPWFPWMRRKTPLFLPVMFELIELPPMPEVIGELEALARDGLSGGWAGMILGPSVRPDGSIIMENNAMFCGDQIIVLVHQDCQGILGKSVKGVSL